MLGNLALARVHGGACQATVVLAFLVLSIPGGLLAGLSFAVHAEAHRRLDVGQGRRGGSVVKVATVLAIGGGVIFALLTFQGATWPMARIFPDPQAGALFFYRAGLALPAVGVLAVLSAGLLVVDRPRVLVPGLTVAVGADLWLASTWLHRGAGDLGFELAGMGLAVPVATLLAAGAAGGLLLANARGRDELAIHQARPFEMGDLAPLARASLGPSTCLAGLALAACTLYGVMLHGETRGDLTAITMALLAAGAALALALDRGGDAVAGWTPSTVLLLSALGLAGLVLVASPGPLARGLVPGLHHGDPSMTAVRLVGALMLHEGVLFLLTRAGWLRRRLPTWIEVAATVLLVTVAALILVLWGRHGAVPLVLALLVSRAALLPVLRR